MPARRRRDGPARSAVTLLLCLFLVTGCIPTTPRIIKIGLVAPFEGRFREIGVDVIPAARLAIREWAIQGGSSRISLELVAYDDAGDVESAVEQARKLAADPDVVIVIGHWLDETTQSALPVYQEAGLIVVTYSEADLPFEGDLYNLAPSADRVDQVLASIRNSRGLDLQRELATAATLVETTQHLPSEDEAGEAFPAGNHLWGLDQFYSLAQGRVDRAYVVSGFGQATDLEAAGWSPELRAAFVEGYQAGSSGAPPGLFAAQAYEATWTAIRLVLDVEEVEYADLPVNEISFDERLRRLEAPIFLYQWQGGQRVLIWSGT